MSPKRRGRWVYWQRAILFEKLERGRNDLYLRWRACTARLLASRATAVTCREWGDAVCGCCGDEVTRDQLSLTDRRSFPKREKGQRTARGLAARSGTPSLAWCQLTRDANVIRTDTTLDLCRLNPSIILPRSGLPPCDNHMKPTADRSFNTGQMRTQAFARSWLTYVAGRSPIVQPGHVQETWCCSLSATWRFLIARVIFGHQMERSFHEGSSEVGTTILLSDLSQYCCIANWEFLILLCCCVAIEVLLYYNILPDITEYCNRL
jgi:hypothetical protein